MSNYSDWRLVSTFSMEEFSMVMVCISIPTFLFVVMQVVSYVGKGLDQVEAIRKKRDKEELFWARIDQLASVVVRSHSWKLGEKR